MASEFTISNVSVCSRASNKLAHELASIGCKMPSGDHAAWDDVPPFLEGLAVTEE